MALIPPLILILCQDCFPFHVGPKGSFEKSFSTLNIQCLVTINASVGVYLTQHHKYIYRSVLVAHERRTIAAEAH